MHIAYNGWFWDQPHTGSGQYIRRLLHALRRADPDLHMTLILPPHNTEPDDLPHNVSIATTSGPRGRFGKVWFEQRIYPQIAARVQADIAHVPYWGPPLASPVKLVTSILDVIPLVIPEYARGLANRLYTALVSAAAAGSSHTITISEAARSDIVRLLRLPDSHLSVTYLGVDEVFHPRLGAEHDEAVRAKYDLPDRFVLCMGGFDVRKNIRQLLQAYTYVVQAQGDDLPLVMAGKEPRWGGPVFPDMRKYAADLGIGDYVRWLGYFDEADKPALYRLATVFVHPTLLEGFGLPPLEAMACGTPVVANAIDVYKETLGDGAFLVDTVRAMAGAIIALALQEPFRKTLVNQGLAQATRYTWRKSAQRTLAVYEQVMKT